MSSAPSASSFLLPSFLFQTFLIIFCFFLMVQLKRLIPRRPSSNQLSSPSPLQPPDRRTQPAFIIHPNQIRATAGWSKLLFFPHTPFIPPSLLSALSSPLWKNCLLLSESARTPTLAYTHTRALPDPPASHSPSLSWKMSNSLIVITRLCHRPIIGMIKDEIFAAAGLLT